MFDKMMRCQTELTKTLRYLNQIKIHKSRVKSENYLKTKTINRNEAQDFHKRKLEKIWRKKKQKEYKQQTFT